MKKKILVLCTGNSCRSQIAHGYLQLFGGDIVEVYSAGVETHGVNPRAIAIMKEDNIDISSNTSNNVLENQSIDFDTANYCHIPIASIVDPSYVGSTDASNFSVQVTFGTSSGYPVVSSIKTEVVTLSSIENLKITFYAKEFDGTNWIDISGSRTANLNISVV